MKVMVEVEQRAGCFLCSVVLIMGPALIHYCKEREIKHLENGRFMRLNVSYTKHCESGG